MIFLTEEDFEDYQVRAEVLSVLRISNKSLDSAELAAIEQVTEAIRTRFDAQATFAAIGTSRNPLLIMYMIDLVLYHLHSNTPSRVIPKARDDRFNAAKEWLDKVNGGTLIPTLPSIELPTKDPNHRFGNSGRQQFRRW